MTSTPESFIAKQSPEQLKYSNELNAILSRQLTPETIDTYAADALDDLIGLVSEVTDVYAQSHQSEVSFNSHRQMEDAAFTIYGLDDIESILDHVADMTQEINQIDDVISNSKSINRVIIPANLSNFRAEGDGGQFKESISVPRLKTLLFVLSNDFGIDINDRAQLQITKGQNDPNMMRKESYHMVDVPDLDRLIMVCDEEGNATYVFDKSVINENNLNDIDLIDCSKTDLNSLIDEYPNLGKRIIYSKNYIRNIKINIGNPLDDLNDDNDVIDLKGNNYLSKAPKAPEDYASVKSMVKNLHSTKINEAIELAITKYGDAFGEVNKYMFRANTADGYSPEQQAMIKEFMDVAPKAPENYVSANSMLKNQHSTKINEAIESAMIKYGDAFGEVNKYMFSGVKADGYSPEQQAMIETFLDIVPKAPENYTSANTISKNLHSTKINEAIELAITKYGDAFGEVNKYMFRANTADGYSPEQQAMIKEFMDVAPKAPENYASASSMLKNLHSTKRAEVIELAITKYGDAFGEVNRYMFGKNTAEGYSPEQQIMIETCIDMTLKAPENYTSVKSMSKNLHSTKINEAIELATTKYGDAFGEVNKYMFGKNMAEGYSPEQQIMIENCLNKIKQRRKVGNLVLSNANF